MDGEHGTGKAPVGGRTRYWATQDEEFMLDSPQDQADGHEGLWDTLTDMELAAQQQLAPELRQFLDPLRLCYGCGVEAPTLPGTQDKESHIRLAAIFLKRALTDLRVVWKLVSTGYTSQAAAIAATLYENALTVTVLSSDPRNAAIVQADPRGEIPWKPERLAKMFAKHRIEREVATGKRPQYDNDLFEVEWRDIYSAYVYFCKMKHPTLRSALHESKSTALPSGEFVVMATPDVRPVDMPLKATIVGVSGNRTIHAILDFILGLQSPPGEKRVTDCKRRLAAANIQLLKCLRSFEELPLPFHIGDDPRASEWAAAKAKGPKQVKPRRHRRSKRQ